MRISYSETAIAVLIEMFVKERVIIIDNRKKGTITAINRNNGKKYNLNPEMYDLINSLHNGSQIPEEYLNILIQNELVDDIGRCRYPFRVVTEDSFQKLFITMTDSCNLFCKHCCRSCGPKQQTTISIDAF